MLVPRQLRCIKLIFVYFCHHCSVIFNSIQTCLSQGIKIDYLWYFVFGRYLSPLDL